jgi:hypothetical protein
MDHRYNSESSWTSWYYSILTWIDYTHDSWSNVFFNNTVLSDLWRFIWSNSTTKIHVIEHTWFPNTHSSCRFYDNSRFKNFVFVFFSSYKQTHERSSFAKTIDPREWDPKLISTLQHSLYNQPWLLFYWILSIVIAQIPNPLWIQLELYFFT